MNWHLWLLEPLIVFKASKVNTDPTKVWEAKSVVKIVVLWSKHVEVPDSVIAEKGGIILVLSFDYVLFVQRRSALWNISLLNIQRI